MVAYYNEIDPKAAAWLRELIKEGHIASGDVDERSIEDVTPDELKRYTQCHFFAGIGVWSYALRQAGWPDDRPVWTGSCPCQPFSAAGKGGGFDDERHLWPHFHWLISQCRPDIVFGEQVASKDGLAWLDLVQADLEGTGYASGAIDLCAAGVGAPHIRQRLWWVGERLAHHGGPGLSQLNWHQREPQPAGSAKASPVGRLADLNADGCHQGPIVRFRDAEHNLESCGGTGRMADNQSEQLPRGCQEPSGEPGASGLGEPSGGCCDAGGLADRVSIGRRTSRDRHNAGDDRSQLDADGRNDGPSPTDGLWADADWLHCRDGKWRPVEPGTFPLAHGAPARVGRLRGYGNAIVAPAAQAFIEAYLEAS